MGKTVEVKATAADGLAKTFKAILRIDTPQLGCHGANLPKAEAHNCLTLDDVWSSTKNVSISELNREVPGCGLLRSRIY